MQTLLAVVAAFDLATGAPVSGVRVTTRADGTIAASAPGYIAVTRHDPGAAGPLMLAPLAISAQDEARIMAARAGLPRGLAAEGDADLTPRARAILAGAEGPVFALTPPQSVRVWRRGLDGSTDSCSGRVDVLPLEDYIKGVVPHEWIASWQTEALAAGALAARSYAWFWVASGGKYSCADLDDTTASQVYQDSTTASTDAAVDATAGQGIARAGAIVFAQYSAENGDPTADGVDEPFCAGLAVQGHGHGMCQWGTQRWALNDRDSRWMVQHYYPGADVIGGAPAYAASYVGQSQPAEMTAGATAAVFVEYRNDGAQTWNIVGTQLGTTLPRNRVSAFYAAGSWLGPNRPAAADHSNYTTGVVGRFTFVLQAPNVQTDTTYVEHFGLVQEGVGWFGPADDAVRMTLLVHPAAPGADSHAGAGCSLERGAPDRRCALAAAACLIATAFRRRSRPRR